jgi:uncharacterized circularly permuted ATP-grasp superfamily protein
MSSVNPESGRAQRGKQKNRAIRRGKYGGAQPPYIQVCANELRDNNTQAVCSDYEAGEFFDELIDPSGQPRPAARALCDYLGRLGPEELEARRGAVDAAIMAMGITFTVYSDAGNIDRAWPFDIIPRVMARKEWERIEAGLKQRLTALNLFINDLYNEQKHRQGRRFPDRSPGRLANFRPNASRA